MKVNEFRNGMFVEAVRESLESDQNKHLLEEVVQRVDGRSCYLMGGRVRDPIINAMHGRNIPFKDYDIIVDDSEGPIDLASRFPGEMNSFGNPKWRPKQGIEFDVYNISVTRLCRTKPQTPITIQSAILGVDITTSAIGYGLQDHTLYEHLALEGIIGQKIGILAIEQGIETAVIARLSVHAAKLQFRVTTIAQDFIREHYTKDFEPYLATYCTRYDCQEYHGEALAIAKRIARTKAL